MVYNYVSIKNIIEGIHRDYAHQEELEVMDLIEWSGEALDLIGAGVQYEIKVVDLQICDYKVALPCNFVSLNMISYLGVPLVVASGVFSPSGEADGTSSTKQTIYGKEVTTNNFKNLSESTVSGSNRYYINNSFIFTNFKEGCITISYDSVPTDDEGFPKIPDDVYYSKAIKSYCQMMLDRQGWRAQKIPEAIYRDSQRDWDWYCVGARGKANMPNLDKLDSIKRQWLKLKPNTASYEGFFSDLGVPERKKFK